MIMKVGSNHFVVVHLRFTDIFTPEICEDVQEECQKYGKILSMKIPRPSGGGRQSAGIGKIFIKFEDKESAKKALQALAGRKFADRTVVTTYYDEVCSDKGQSRGIGILTLFTGQLRRECLVI